MTVFIVAPFKAHNDFRLVRLVMAFKDMECEVHVLVDSNYHGNARLAGGEVEDFGATYHRRQLTGAGGMPRLRPRAWLLQMESTFCRAGLVLVQDSGLLGVYLISVLRRHRCGTILFDYHDLMEYEVFHQLGKFRLQFLTSIVISLLRPWIGKWVRSASGIVGIHDEQLRHLISRYGYANRSLALGNTRPQDAPSYHEKPGADALLWIGNIMRGRGLESLFDKLALVDVPDLRVSVFGRILHPECWRILSRSLGEKLEYFGPFESDLDIGAALTGKVVSVLQGWDDPMGTGINLMASPNKYYTYLNLGLPMLVDLRLIHLAREVERRGAGKAVDLGDSRSITDGLKAILAAYGDFCAAAVDMKTAGGDPNADLKKFLALFIQA